VINAVPFPLFKSFHAPERRPDFGEGATNRAFFVFVGIAITVIVVTGYLLVMARYGGFAGAPGYVHAMHLLAWTMAALFIWLLVFPFRNMRQQLALGEYAAAAGELNRIRHIVTINLLLGVVVIVAATAGPYL
jgi:uncharacterized membrane protein